MNKLYINPYIFFLLKKGKTIIWDYKNHSQFELNEKYFNRLKKISENENSMNSDMEDVDNDLLEAKLISLFPYEKIDWKWDELGQMYHIGTQDVCGNEEYNDEGFVENYYEFCKQASKHNEYQYITYTGEKIALPEPFLDKMNQVSILKSIKKRMTSRSFNGQKVNIRDFSTLLFVNFSLIHGEWKELKEKGLMSLGIRKAHPSGGGLHPVEAYVVVFNVENIPNGIYHYNVKGHYLTRITPACTYDNLKHALCGQFFVEGISFGIFLVAHFEKVWDKYSHSRSYKDVYLDAGHASQTVLLTATSLGLLTWETAWFKDSEVISLLNINGISVAPLFFLGLGYGRNIAVPQKLLDLIQK